MFTRRPSQSRNESFSKRHRSSSNAKRSFREHGVSKTRNEKSARAISVEESPMASPALTSSIITLIVGPEQRLFAAHEDVLCISPFFASACRNQFLDNTSKRIALPDEEPEIFSSVLEYLYKGDYYPRLVHDKRRGTWALESGSEVSESTIYHHGVDGDILKDTVIYCTADKYGLDELKRVALRKQGLQSGIQCSTILTSARYAYSHTPDTDSALRAHYLALIIRSRNTFKKSGTMQLEMSTGGTGLFFDLFVALCNHVDDVAGAAASPRSFRFH